MDPPGDPEAQTGVNEHQPTPPNDTVDDYADPSGKLWSMYLTEADTEDGQMTKNWTKDTQGVLVFTGLFSSIVATFITISLPKLSPDSGDQTVALLSQLVNISTRAPVVKDTPFIAPASIVRVNILWFLSLILSLSCALLATLMQQWARRYLGFAQYRGAPRKQARIREYMFEGVQKFRMSQAVEAMPFLLHTSVFLFFAGLIEFLFTINNAVAHSTLGCAVFFASIYAILTLLPTWRLNCPYRTPLSGITYSSLQFSWSSFFLAADRIEDLFHEKLLDIWRQRHPDVQGSQNHGPTKWRDVLEQKVHTYCKRLKHSLRWRVVDSAMKAPSSVDKSALQRTLTTLDETKKIEEFAARMPGFFNSKATPDATSAMLSLMSDSERPKSGPILGSRLQELLDTCQPGSSFLTEEQRKSRLSVCLTSLWYCLRAFNLPKNSGMPLPAYVRAIFTGPEEIRWIQTEKDLAIRLLGRCFGSLVVKKLVNDINSRRTPTSTLTGAPASAPSAPTGANISAPSARTGVSTSAPSAPTGASTSTPSAPTSAPTSTPASAPTGISPTTEEMACLQSILGATGVQVWRWLDHKGAVDLENLTFLVSGELETLVKSGTNGVPADVVDVFQQTLRILGEGMFSSRANVEWDTDQVARFHDIYFEFAGAPVPDVLKERLRYIWDRLGPSAPYMQKPKMRMPSPKLESETTPSSPGPSQIRVGPVRIEGAPDSGYAEGIISTPISAQLYSHTGPATSYDVPICRLFLYVTAHPPGG